MESSHKLHHHIVAFSTEWDCHYQDLPELWLTTLSFKRIQASNNNWRKLLTLKSREEDRLWMKAGEITLLQKGPTKSTEQSLKSGSVPPIKKSRKTRCKDLAEDKKYPPERSSFKLQLTREPEFKRLWTTERSKDHLQDPDSQVVDNIATWVKVEEATNLVKMFLDTRISNTQVLEPVKGLFKTILREILTATIIMDLLDLKLSIVVGLFKGLRLFTWSMVIHPPRINLKGIVDRIQERTNKIAARIEGLKKKTTVFTRCKFKLMIQIIELPNIE